MFSLNQRLVLATIACGLCAVASSLAQQATEPDLSGPAPPAPKPTPSENVTINLLHRMVERGLLKEEDAEELIKEAESDAAIAHAAAAEKSSKKTASFEPSAPAEGDAETEEPENEVSVTYVPDIVKQQLRDEIRA
jgi:hypothetical protein